MTIFQTVNKNMIPEKYKQMSTEELENRVREVKERLGSDYLFQVIIIKRMKSFSLQMLKGIL